MNELKVKQGKCVGRRWAFISTSTGVICAFLIWVFMNGYAKALNIFDGPYLYFGIISAFLFSNWIGSNTAKQVFYKKSETVAIWMLYGFLNTFISFCIPFIIMSVVDNFSIVALVQTVFMCSFFSLIIGFIPIMFFGYIYGQSLQKELTVLFLENKKEPKI